MNRDRDANRELIDSLKDKAVAKSTDATTLIAAWIAAKAPASTSVAVGWVSTAASFSPAEAALVSRSVRSRRNEFATGRRLAREALAQLGCIARDLPPDSSRVPQWPEGFVGTISHSTGLCVALAARKSDFDGIGVDIEKLVSIDREMTTLICRQDENILDKYAVRENLAIFYFVAKEAFFKAYFPLSRVFIGFHDVRIDLDLPGGFFTARLVNAASPSLAGVRTFSGRIAVLGEYAVASVWIESPDINASC